MVDQRIWIRAEELGLIIYDALRAQRRRSRSQREALPRQRGCSRDELVTTHLRRQAGFIGVVCHVVNGALMLCIVTESGETWARLASLRVTRSGVLVTNPKRWLLPSQMKLGDDGDTPEWGTPERPMVLGHTGESVYFGLPDFVTGQGRGVGFHGNARLLGTPLPAPPPERVSRPRDRVHARRKKGEADAG